LTFQSTATSQPVTVSLAAGTEISSAVSQINTALQTAGITSTASFSSGAFSLTNNQAGDSSVVTNQFSSNLTGSTSGSSINLDLVTASGSATVIADGGLNGGTAGQNVQGTIDGNVATSQNGNELVGPTGSDVDGVTLSITAGATGSQGTVTVAQNSMVMQIGAFANQTAVLSLSDTSAANLGTTATGTTTLGGAGQSAVNVANLNVNTEAGAQDAILVLDAAIQQVSTERANLGAFQSDILQSSVSNLQSEQQNISSAESGIQDANLAQESVSFSKANILQQTGMAMLSQANQAPQLLLKLFQ
jgi:flagellin